MSTGYAVTWGLSGTAIFVTAVFGGPPAIQQIRAWIKEGKEVKAYKNMEAGNAIGTNVANFVSEVQGRTMTEAQLRQRAKQYNLELSPVDEEFAEMGRSYAGFQWGRDGPATRVRDPSRGEFGRMARSYPGFQYGKEQ